MNPIAGGSEHRERGVDILALEIAVEGVGEQNDFFAVMPGFMPGIARLCNNPPATSASSAAH